MSDHAGTRTTMRMQLVLLRLQGLTLSALVHRDVLTMESAMGIVSEAAAFLPHEANDPQTEALLLEAFERLRKDLKDIHQPAQSSG